MLTASSKKPARLLTLSLLAFAAYLVINGQQAWQTPLTDAESKQANISVNTKAVSIRSVNKGEQPRLSVHVSTPQAAAERGLSPEDWLADFKAAYPTDDNAVRKLMTGINAEQRPEFVEQLLRQVQFLPEGDAVRDALENVLMMHLAELDRPRAANYVIAALAQQKQSTNLNLFQHSNNPAISEILYGRHQLIGALMQSWGKQNLPEGNARSGLLTQLAEQKAQIDPEAAVAWVSN